MHAVSIGAHRPPDTPSLSLGLACCPITQSTVYNAIGKPIVDNALDGFNNTVFAYGQTGSGKTYSMMGNPDDKGITPRLCDDLFERIDKVSLDVALPSQTALPLQLPLEAARVVLEWQPGPRRSFLQDIRYSRVPDCLLTKGLRAPVNPVAAARTRS